MESQLAELLASKSFKKISVSEVSSIENKKIKKTEEGKEKSSKKIKSSKPEKKEINSDLLFEGVPVAKIKKQEKKPKDMLLEYIKKDMPKEELLDMGFSINEINIASILCEQQSKQ